MTEYALIKDGVIDNIVTSAKSITEMREQFRAEGYHILPVDVLPEHMVSRYRYWNERP